jgi:hypothetical protein
MNKEYITQQKRIISLLPTNIIGYRPGIGEYITVNGLEIAKETFPEEFNQIVELRHKVIQKINDTNV